MVGDLKGWLDRVVLGHIDVPSNGIVVSCKSVIMSNDFLHDVGNSLFSIAASFLVSISMIVSESDLIVTFAFSSSVNIVDK